MRLNRAGRFAHPAAWLALAVTGALVQGCTPPPPAPAPTGRVFAADLAGGARSCTAPKNLKLENGRETPATVTVGNDGGWCAITVSLPGPRPYSAGLLVGRPAHGKVYVHTVGDETRIDYTPDRGYAGPDSFAVSLIPGGPVIRATVAVTRG